jgi:hypothetical protein
VSVWGGRPDLPGPLAHGYLSKSGTVTMTANGRANHAGGGSPAVLAAVVNESPLPATHYHEGSLGAADGNAHFYGLEISNLGNGRDPYPAVQYDAAVRWAAAICRFHKWSAKSVIGHKEWSDWKSDPNFDISKFRAALAHGPSASAPVPAKENSMTLTDADAKKVWGYKGPGDTPDVHQTLEVAGKNAAAALAAVKALDAKVTALIAVLNRS